MIKSLPSESENPYFGRFTPTMSVDRKDQIKMVMVEFSQIRTGGSLSCFHAMEINSLNGLKPDVIGEVGDP